MVVDRRGSVDEDGPDQSLHQRSADTAAALGQRSR